MNIRSVSRSMIQDIAHQSAYVYGVSKEMLPPKSPQVPDTVTLPGRANLETTYRYSYVPAWLGDVPVVFTFLNAQRSYEYTKQIFSNYNDPKRTANSTSNSWLV